MVSLEFAYSIERMTGAGRCQPHFSKYFYQTIESVSVPVRS
jgi:hypothetical protein